MDSSSGLRAQVAADVAALGLPRGATVSVHASVKALSGGSRAGGFVDAVLNGLLDCVGNEGTVFTPTHTYCFKGSAFAKSSGFHAGLPSLTGLLSEAVRQHPKAVRSEHPTHSVAAIGKHARALTDPPPPPPPASTPTGSTAADNSAAGPHSPYTRLLAGEAGVEGYVLLLGCGFESNTLVHSCELRAGAPYCKPFCFGGQGWAPVALVETAASREQQAAGSLECQVEEVDLELVPGCSEGFQHRLEPLLSSSGRLKTGRVLHAPTCMLMKASDVMDAVEQLLRDEHESLLCKAGACSGALPELPVGHKDAPCEFRRRYLASLAPAAPSRAEPGIL